MAMTTAVLLVAGLSAASAQDWSARGEGASIEAGSLIDGAFAGLLFRCAGEGRIETVLTHNGAVFDRAQTHTIVLSVDGVATMLPARALAGSRPGDDDFVHVGPAAETAPLLDALSRGSALEVSGPSGRYRLGLDGSSKAIAAFRAGCPAA